MNRFYCPSPSIGNVGDRPCDAAAGALSDGPPLVIDLPRDEAHHALRVLRLRGGDAVELFDGRGGVARGTLAADGRSAQVRVERTWHEPAAQPTIDVAVSLPKGPRADSMVAAVSQAGATTVIPLRVTRSVVQPREAKLERFAKAAIESAKQCGRAHVMRIAPMATLDDLLAEPCDMRLLADPQGSSLPQSTAMKRAGRVLILIGPEGGWTDAELATADAAGCLRWWIGPHVLRIETAAATAVGIARYLCGPDPL